MNFLHWIVRGIGNYDTRIALKNLYMSHKPVLIFIADLARVIHCKDQFGCLLSIMSDFFRDRCGIPNYGFP